MQDLSMVKEVRELRPGYGSLNSAQGVNELLASGNWILLDVKMIETITLAGEDGDHEFETAYVLGRIN